MIDAVIVEENQHGIFIEFPDFTDSDIHSIDKDEKYMIILLIRKFIRLFQIVIQNHRQRCDEPAAGKMQDLIKAEVGIPVIAASNQGGKIRKDRRHDVDSYTGLK